MRIGFAQKDITPAIGKQMPGGAHVLTTTKPARGKLLATAAAFEENGEAVLLVSIDMLHMSDAFANAAHETSGVFPTLLSKTACCINLSQIKRVFFIIPRGKKRVKPRKNGRRSAV